MNDRERVQALARIHSHLAGRLVADQVTWLLESLEDYQLEAMLADIAKDPRPPDTYWEVIAAEEDQIEESLWASAHQHAVDYLGGPVRVLRIEYNYQEGRLVAVWVRK